MLRYKDKDLQDLGLEETIEFEKDVLKKVLAANTAQMSETIIDQLNGYLAHIRVHKQEQIGKLIDANKPKQQNQGGSLLIGENEPELPDDIE